MKKIIVLMLMIVMVGAKANCLSFKELKNRYERDFKIKIPDIKTEEVTVAIIDTGINPNIPGLKSRLYIPKLPKGSYGVDFSKKKVGYQPEDDHGHGSHIAGILLAINPNIKILPLKYYNINASGQMNLNNSLKALKFAIESNVDMINYSGGGAEKSPEEFRLLKEAENKGIIVVVAAGNEESDIDKISNAYYPASYNFNNVISVMNHRIDKTKANSSNWGSSSVDTSFYGHRILSYGGSKTLSNECRMIKLTGTSQATPFITAFLAYKKGQNKKISFDEIKREIYNSTEINKLKNKSNGSFDPNKFFKISREIGSKK